MKISYSIKNLRAIQEMDPVELRPITVLVGANSSGKSTFLRSFSLLRQSLEKETNEPVLWFGDFVDFGDYKTSVFDNKLRNEIAFKFEIKDFIPSHYFSTLENGKKKVSGRKDVVINKKENKINKLSYNVYLKSNKGNTNVSEYELIIDEVKLKFSISVENGNVFMNLDYNNRIYNDKINSFIEFETQHLFPNFEFFDKPTKNDESFYYRSSSRYFTKILLDSMEKYKLDGIKTSNIRSEIVNLFNIIPIENIKLSDESSIKNNIISQSELYGILCQRGMSDILEKIDQYCVSNFMFSTFQEVAGILHKFFLATSLLGPVRNLGKRFYRYQALDVTDISINSQNFPMVLSSWKDNGELKKFSNWVKDLIGYEIDVERNVGNVSVMVKYGLRKENLTDTGFGISQLLPVLAQIWLIAHPGYDHIIRGRSRQSGRKVVAIEEPELHLHPKFQSSLTDAFASAVSNGRHVKQNPIFIIETHSEVMINRLGELIEMKQLNAEDVQVVLFSKGEGNSIATEIRTTTYTDDGILRDWPYGFFRY